MAFVVNERLSTLAKRFRGTLTAEERAHLYASRTPIAVVMASLGGHPANAARRQPFSS